MAIDAPQTTAEASPERHQQAADLSRDIQSQFKPADNSFKPGDQTKLNSELNGFGFPDIQIGNDNHLQDQGKDAQNVKNDDGNLSYDRTGPNGDKQHVTLNMTDHPGLETVQNDKVPPQVTQTTETDAHGKQHTTDYAYDAGGKLTSAKLDGNEMLPPNASQAEVDPKSGQLSYTTSDAADYSKIITTTVKPDGTVGTSTDANFQPTADGKVWIPPGQAPITVPRDLNNGTIDERGHLNYTYLGDKVDVAPDGHETRTRTDGTVIDRNRNGELTGYNNPTGPKFENGNWTGLPGLNGNDKPKNLQVNEDGTIDYTTPAGITVGLDSKGQAAVYSSKDFTMRHDPDHPNDPNKWIFQQDGHPIVPIDKPQIQSDGTVTSTQHTPLGDQPKKLTGAGADQPVNLDWDKMGGEAKQALELLKNPQALVEALKLGVPKLVTALEDKLPDTVVKAVTDIESMPEDSAGTKAAKLAAKATELATNPAAGALFGAMDIMNGITALNKAGEPGGNNALYAVAAADFAAGAAGLAGAGAETLAMSGAGGELTPAIAAAGEIANAINLGLGLGVSIYDWTHKS